MKRKRKAGNGQVNKHRLISASYDKRPFIEHFKELRRRFVYIVISIALWGGAAYAIEQHIINVLIAPAHGQSFIYTSPIDGINFLFKLCLYIGIALSIPVVVYHFMRFMEPLMRRSSSRFIYGSVLISGLLAAGGMAFGYFIGLPTALHFLLHQFVSVQIRPLLTIDAYLSFVIVYLLGSALMFQIPLLILLIHRIKPLTPQGLIRHERWAILFAVVLGGIMNPTPNLIDQLFVIGPIILSYQLGIVLVWRSNHVPKHLKHVASLRIQDQKIQSERADRAAVSRAVSVEPLEQAVVQSPEPKAISARPQQYANSFALRRRTLSIVQEQ